MSDQPKTRNGVPAGLNQPKPATGSQNPGREEIYDEMTSRIKGDKPASGEWTAETVQKFISYDFTLNWCAKVADAHNASLAAKQEELATLKRDYVQLDEIKSKYRDQLAAERVEHRKTIDGAQKYVNESQAQLAAEKAKLQALQDDKKRLDWLCGPGKYTDWNDLDITNPLTFRDSIDAALRSAPHRLQDDPGTLRNA